jgi:hypothetical protein
MAKPAEASSPIIDSLGKPTAKRKHVEQKQQLNATTDPARSG